MSRSYPLLPATLSSSHPPCGLTKRKQTVGRRGRHPCPNRNSPLPAPSLCGLRILTDDRQPQGPLWLEDLLKSKWACFHWLRRQNEQTRKAMQQSGLCLYKTKPHAQEAKRASQAPTGKPGFLTAVHWPGTGSESALEGGREVQVLCDTRGTAQYGVPCSASPPPM